MVIEEECRPKAEYRRGRGQRQFLRPARRGIKGENGERGGESERQAKRREENGFSPLSFVLCIQIHFAPFRC